MVRLTDDYFSLRNDKKDAKSQWKAPSEIDPQEAKLMYVALTREQKDRPDGEGYRLVPHARRYHAPVSGES